MLRRPEPQQSSESTPTSHTVETDDLKSEVPEAPSRVKTTPVQFLLLGLGTVAFLYFARPVVLPVFLACMATMTLKPLMRWLSLIHIPTVPAAAFIFILLVGVLGVGFFQLGRPAVHWIDDLPEHVGELKARVQKIFPNAMKMGTAVTAVSDLGAAADKKGGQKGVATVEIKDQRGTSSILNWTGTVLGGLGEVLVLIYLLLASGDLFMQKLVRVMPTLKDKKRAVEITHEIQANISMYLFSVSIINISLGAVASVIFYILNVPKPGMWGMLVAILNFVPYFGPIVGVGLVAMVGLLTFDTLWQGLMPAIWYLMLHLTEANFVTPILLGRRFTLNPVAIFISLMFWLWLWGIPGALLSVPILVTIKAACDRIPKASYVSELIGR